MNITLFVNGDSHTACVYDSDCNHDYTATKILSEKYGLEYKNIALLGGSNQRIVRTTIEHLPTLDPRTTVIVVGWSSFERSEWYFDGRWHQICGDISYKVDTGLQHRWENHVNMWQDESHRARMTLEQHQSIWCLHILLKQLGYQHLFYQGTKMSFFDGCIFDNNHYRLPWESSVWAHEPYVSLNDFAIGTESENIKRQSFSWYVESQGCACTDDRDHYGSDAHQLWAQYLEPLLQTKLNQIRESYNAC